jgi:hypothetical protein
MADVQEQVIVDEEAPSPYRWVVRGIYAALIGANLWIAFDWWRDTEGGRAMLDRAKALAAECEGCAQRKALLRRATARMHRQAQEIVEGADTESQPEAQ